MKRLFSLLALTCASCASVPVEIDLLAGMPVEHQRAGGNPLGTVRVRVYPFGAQFVPVEIGGATFWVRAHAEGEHISSIPGPDRRITNNLNGGVTVRFGGD